MNRARGGGWVPSVRVKLKNNFAGVTRQKICRELLPAKSCLQTPTVTRDFISMGLQVKLCLLQLLLADIRHVILRIEDDNMSLQYLFADNLVAHLHVQTKQATVIFVFTKLHVITSKSVNSILQRPALIIVLVIDSVPLKMEQHVSQILSGYHD